jgi:hypothetical protein
MIFGRVNWTVAGECASLKTIASSTKQQEICVMLPETERLVSLFVTIHKIKLGDGSFRFCEQYVSGNHEVGGADLATLEGLEARVRQVVALDWKEIAEHLKSNDSWSAPVSIHREAAAQLFDN